MGNNKQPDTIIIKDGTTLSGSSHSILRPFVGLSSFEMIAMFRRGLFYSFLSVYLRHYLGLSVTETTLFATLPMIMNVVFQTFVWGRVSDKFQLRRTLIISGEILAGIGTILVWYGHRLSANLVLSGYVIIVGLALIEIFWSMSNVGWSALISDVYTVEKRSKIQGRLASLGGIGRIAGVWIGGLLYDGLGHKYPGWGFYEGSIFIMATAAMFLSTLPMLFVPEGGLKSKSSTSDGIDDISDNHALKGVFAFFLTAMMFINFGRNSIVLTQPQYLMLESGLAVSSSVLGYIVNTQSVAMILCGLVAGGIANLLGTGRALLTGTLSAVASILLIAVSTDLKMIYLSYFLRGLSEVIIMATSYTFASTLIPPQKRGRQFALYNATFFLSWGLAGTLITGPLVDLLIKNGHVHTIAYRISFFIAAALTILGFGLLTYLLYGIMPKRHLGFRN